MDNTKNTGTLAVSMPVVMLNGVLDFDPMHYRHSDVFTHNGYAQTTETYD